MNLKKKIICTLGPSTLNNKNISLMKKNGVNIFRLNMSHLTIKNLKKNILLLKKNNIKNICLDTEGAQLRTTKVKKEFYLKKNYLFHIYNDNLNSNKKKNLYFS